METNSLVFGGCVEKHTIKPTESVLHILTSYMAPVKNSIYTSGTLHYNSRERSLQIVGNLKDKFSSEKPVFSSFRSRKILVFFTRIMLICY